MGQKEFVLTTGCSAFMANENETKLPSCQKQNKTHNQMKGERREEKKQKQQNEIPAFVLRMYVV